MTIKKIIARAVRMKRIKDGFVLCDNCDTPADKGASTAMSMAICGPCAFGEADALDPTQFIYVGGAR